MNGNISHTECPNTITLISHCDSPATRSRILISHSDSPTVTHATRSRTLSWEKNSSGKKSKTQPQNHTQQPHLANEREIKVALMGSKGVGKSGNFDYCFKLIV